MFDCFSVGVVFNCGDKCCWDVVLCDYDGLVQVFIVEVLVNELIVDRCFCDWEFFNEDCFVDSGIFDDENMFVGYGSFI